MASVYLLNLRSDPAEEQKLVGELLRTLQEQAGVIASGFTGDPPLSGYSGGTSRQFAIDSHRNLHSETQVLHRWVSPNYFPAIGTRLLAGNSTAPVAAGAMAQCVLSYNLASQFFPEESAVGRIVYTSTAGEPDGSDLDPKHGCLVVGVAENARVVSLRIPAPELVYTVISPDVQGQAGSEAFASINLIVHAEAGALGITALHNSVREVIPSVRAARYRTFHQMEDTDLNRERMLVNVSGVFAILALLLTALGMYGLLMRTVVLRTREIGIRISLGAKRNQVVMSVARRVIIELGIGLFTGAAITIFLMQGIRHLLESVPSAGASTYLIGAGMILLVSAVAVFFPARRAASVDPVRALRSD